jgi:hypothetical protein
LPGPEAQKLRWPTRLDMTLSRVQIGYAFIKIVTELKIYHIYKTVLQLYN